MTPFRRILRRPAERGANAVEFALILPVLMAIITGVMDYGWYFTQQHLVVNAVREGARAGALTRAMDGPEDVAIERVAAVLTDAGVAAGTAEISADVEAAVFPATIRVAVSLPYPPLVGFVPVPSNLSATLIMRMEDQEAYF